MKLEWEDIDPYHKRAKVFGGWLVKAYEDVYTHKHLYSHAEAQRDYEWRIAMTFVPDEFYRWELNDHTRQTLQRTLLHQNRC